MQLVNSAFAADKLTSLALPTLAGNTTSAPAGLSNPAADLAIRRELFTLKPGEPQVLTVIPAQAGIQAAIDPGFPHPRE
jgi:hypothetical protein